MSNQTCQLMGTQRAHQQTKTKDNKTDTWQGEERDIKGRDAEILGERRLSFNGSLSWTLKFLQSLELI